MLAKSIRILNFDDSIIKQKKVLAQYESAIFELSDIGPRVRYWMYPGLGRLIGKRIRNSDRNSATFLGSGDFHHISRILISRFDEPLCVIVFDYSCGSWITRILKRKNVLKLILLGSRDARPPGKFKDSRVEIYPYSLSPDVSITGIKSPDTGFFNDLLDRLPVKNVYVSIDKNCLRNDYALTNRKEGPFALDELLSLLNPIKQKLDILGLDVSGDYSPVLLKGVIKRIAFYFNRPKVKSADFPESFVNSINEDTNLKILRLLQKNNI